MVCSVHLAHGQPFMFCTILKSRYVSSNYKMSSHESMIYSYNPLLTMLLLNQYLDELQHKIPIHLAVQTCAASHFISLKFRSGMSHVVEQDAEIQLGYRSRGKNKCWLSSTRLLPLGTLNLPPCSVSLRRSPGLQSVLVQRSRRRMPSRHPLAALLVSQPLRYLGDALPSSAGRGRSLA